MLELFARWSTPELSKNRVTRVTGVTSQELQDNSCNPTSNSRVTRVTSEESGGRCNPCNPSQFARVTEIDKLNQPGNPRNPCNPEKCISRRETQPLAAVWPPEALAEVQELASRLVAGGWTPAQAYTLAAAIVADRRGLAFEDGPVMEESLAE